MSPVRDAVILMAGIGSRLGAHAAVLAKPFVPIAERPLITYTLEALLDVGVERVHAVMGARHEPITAALRPLMPGGLELHPIVNHEWQKQNGVSVLAAAGHVDAPFFADCIAGVSLGGLARMRFRHVRSREPTCALELRAGSLYVMSGEARLQYEHSIGLVKGERHSITLRRFQPDGA